MTDYDAHSPDDARYMAEALALARRGLLTTHPNPRVGCVLLRDGAIVGRGWHECTGAPHAEVNALREAGPAARGATALVTLEPCCHHGRTPPCSTALIEAGVTRVVVAMRDPNPRVAGGGLAALQMAGVQTTCGVLQSEAERLNRGFVSRMQRGRPLVRVKLAMSLDGRTAMADGESRWITGPEARRDVQRQRARSDAVLTGIGTLLADDPSLDVRAEALAGWWAAPAGTPRQPLRVVLDSRLRTPHSARTLGLEGRVLIATCNPDAEAHAPLRAAGAEIAVVPARDGRVDCAAVLALLAAREINEVLVEAGATLAGALLAADLADELLLYIAPSLLGDTARGLLHLPGLERLDDRLQLRLDDLRQVGDDLRLTLSPRPRVSTAHG